MKTLLRILLIVILIFAVISVASYAFLVLQGKAIITRQLESLLHQNVSIGYVGIVFPFNLEMRNLAVPQLAEIDYVSISPSIPGLLSGNIVLNDLTLVNPRLVYEKRTQNNTGREDVSAKSVKSVKSKKNHYLRLIIKCLNIKNGRLDFVDRTLAGEGIKITVKNINFHLTDLYIYPRSAIANFALTGRIPWVQGQAEGRIEAKGWVNLFKKDMQAKVKVDNIDGIYLYPYYSQWVDLEKTPIQSAKLNFSSNIKGRDNNITAECHLELTDIVFKPRPQEEITKAEKIAGTVLGIFKALNQGKIAVNFTIKTRMTSPEFNFGYIKTAVEESLNKGRKDNHISSNGIVKFPVKVVGGTVKSAGDLSKGLIDGTFSLFKELKEAVGAAFKREQ